MSRQKNLNEAKLCFGRPVGSPGIAATVGVSHISTNQFLMNHPAMLLHPGRVRGSYFCVKLRHKLILHSGPAPIFSSDQPTKPNYSRSRDTGTLATYVTHKTGEEGVFAFFSTCDEDRFYPAKKHEVLRNIVLFPIIQQNTHGDIASLTVSISPDTFTATTGLLKNLSLRQNHIVETTVCAGERYVQMSSVYFVDLGDPRAYYTYFSQIIHHPTNLSDSHQGAAFLWTVNGHDGSVRKSCCEVKIAPTFRPTNHPTYMNPPGTSCTNPGLQGYTLQGQTVSIRNLAIHGKLHATTVLFVTGAFRHEIYCVKRRHYYSELKVPVLFDLFRTSNDILSPIGKNAAKSIRKRAIQRASLDIGSTTVLYI